MYIGDENYLIREYYQNDKNGFFYYNTHINCWEQMCYQSLRNYNVDYHLIFCDDISPRIEYTGKEVDIYVNDLEINYKLFHYYPITSSYKKAQDSIKEILSKGNQVIFTTMFDRLKTYIWYKNLGPFNKNLHNSIIIGYDSETTEYFYLDSPYMKNVEYFLPYDGNPSIGKIKAVDLMDALKLFCRIGYIEIDQQELKGFPDFEVLLHSMVYNYFEPHLSADNSPNTSFQGKCAFGHIFQELEKGSVFTIFSVDSFESNLFYSRCQRLKKNLSYYPNKIPKNLVPTFEKDLEKMADEWHQIEMIILKSNISTMVSDLNAKILLHMKTIYKTMNSFFENLAEIYYIK